MGPSSAASRVAEVSRAATEQPQRRHGRGSAILVALEASVYGAAALVIVFTQAHPPRFGLVAFGLVSLATAAVRLPAALRLDDRLARGLALTEVVATLTAGAAGGILALGPTPSSLELILVVGLWAAFSGLLRAAAALRARF